MKRLFFYLPVLLLIASCGKQTSHEKHIPSNAAVVAVMDVQKMTVKAFDMSMLLEQNIFDKKQAPQSDEQSIPIEESGIDFLNKSYLIGHVADNEADNYMGLIMPLSDHGKFRKFATSYAVKKPGEGASNVTYVMVGEGAILGWNQESAIYLINQNYKEDFLLISEIFRLFDLPPENQLTLTSQSFTKTQEEGADISIWMDINKINKYRNPVGMIVPGQKVSQGIYNAWVNFEKGEMQIKTRYYSSNDDSGKKDGALLLKESINANLLKGVQEDRVLGSFNLGLNIPIIKAQMDKDGVLDSSQNYLELVNTNSREVMDMLTGDMTSCLLKSEDDTDFFISLGIKENKTSTKIINALDEFGLIKPFEGYYTLFNQYIILNEKNRVVITSDFEVAREIMDGNEELPGEKLMDDLSKNPIVFSLDLENLPMKSYVKMKSYWKKYPVNFDEIESIYFSQSSISNGVSDGQAYVTFKNKEKNCLVIIARAIKKYSEKVES